MRASSASSNILSTHEGGGRGRHQLASTSIPARSPWAPHQRSVCAPGIAPRDRDRGSWMAFKPRRTPSRESAKAQGTTPSSRSHVACKSCATQHPHPLLASCGQDRDWPFQLLVSIEESVRLEGCKSKSTSLAPYRALSKRVRPHSAALILWDNRDPVVGSACLRALH